MLIRTLSRAFLVLGLAGGFAVAAQAADTTTPGTMMKPADGTMMKPDDKMMKSDKMEKPDKAMKSDDKAMKANDAMKSDDKMMKK